MVVKIINIIFLDLNTYLLKSTSLNFIKNKRKKHIGRKLLKLFVTRLRFKTGKRKFFSRILRRRWRKFYILARRPRTFFKYRIRRRLKKFRRRNIRKNRRARKLIRLFLYFFILCVKEYNTFFAKLLRRFNVFSINFKMRRHHRKYLGNGQYNFDQLILDTFLINRKNLLILTVGNKTFLPENYSYIP